ncbi:hypothetical protein V5T82_14105 [Magnetovibrio sp. PR-2]|uniref:hypothetical protein n=1 Tax=Magnetovibrio sp. PR-2 TaxID=3120356 RepID=UPI002FCE38FE
MNTFVQETTEHESEYEFEGKHYKFVRPKVDILYYPNDFREDATKAFDDFYEAYRDYPSEFMFTCTVMLLAVWKYYVERDESKHWHEFGTKHHHYIMRYKNVKLLASKLRERHKCTG